MSATPDDLAFLAKRWAGEVVVHAGTIKAPPSEMILVTLNEKFGHDLQSRLEVLFYLVLSEAREHDLARPLAPTEVEDKEPWSDLQRMLKCLIYHIQVVAAPWHIQRREIPEHFVILALEVADDFDWVFECFQSGDYRGLLMAEHLSLLSRLSEYLDALEPSAGIEIWTDRALQESPEWQQARALAAECLAAFLLSPPA